MILDQKLFKNWIRLSSVLLFFMVSVTFAGLNKTVEVAIISVEIEHPTGDPTDDPAPSTSVFTYSSNTLTIDCRAIITSSIPEWELHIFKEKIKWTITPIEGASLTWSSPWLEESTAGKGVTTTATFNELPVLNSLFGLKTVTMSVEEYNVIKTTNIECFFRRDEMSHPGGITPNWYYYWGQLTGKEDIVYGGAHASRFGLYDFDGSDGHIDKCIIYDKVVLIDNPTGPKGKAGIDCFGQTVNHERKHKEQFYQGFKDINGDHIPDYDPNQDQDGDWLSDDYEDAHGFDKYLQDSDNDGILDREEDPILAESIWPNNSQKNNDWANPGQNNNY